jgi:hypothetical protein
MLIIFRDKSGAPQVVEILGDELAGFEDALESAS